MRKFLLTISALAGLCLPAAAGDISTGAVPGVINYQGRLERDNAPLTGIVHLTFRVYTTATGNGTTSNTESADCECHLSVATDPDSLICADPFPASPRPCVWTSGELAPVTASQGIFNASMKLPWQALAGGGPRYLEVQVEQDILTPREPLNSVAYAIVARKLEDDAFLRVASITVSGGVGLSPAGIRFPDGSLMTSASVGMSTGGVTSSTSVVIQAATGGLGDIVLATAGNTERARLLNNGRFGIGTSAPGASLDVNGDIYARSALYGNAGGALTVGHNLTVSSGQITGANSEFIRLGVTNDEITFYSGGKSRLHIDPSGNVAIGPNFAAPTAALHVAGIVYSTAAIRASSVTIGGYDANSLPNEIRPQGGAPLVLANYVFGADYNVGVGTNTPTEKLHVKGTVRAEKGVKAATATFTGPAALAGDPVVDVQGNFRANNSQGSYVQLSSTTIYGSLTIVNGTITVQGSSGGSNPAYTDAANNFTKHNTFQNWVEVSSDTVTRYRTAVGAAAINTNLSAENNYLQVGDKSFPTANGTAFIVGGSAANARLKLYRDTAEAASLETQNGVNLAVVVGGQTRLYSDASSTTIKNSTLWVGDSAAAPLLYVSTVTGKVAIGTSTPDPVAKLTVLGSIRISTDSGGQDYGLIFPDGSKMTASSGTSVTILSNNGDSIVESNSGSVLLKSGGVTSLAVRSGGNIAIGGTFTPSSLLNVRGGDLILGNPAQTGLSSSEDLLVAGNIITDGAIKQRSVTSPVEFFSLKIASYVYLSTGTNGTPAMVRIGDDTPPQKTLDVTGDISATGNYYGIMGVTNGGATWNGNTVGATYGGTGNNSYLQGDMLYASAANTLSKLGKNSTATRYISNTGASNGPAWAQVDLTNGVSGTLPVGNGGTNSATALSGNSIMVSNGTSIVQGNTGTSTQVLHGNLGYSAVSLTADVSGTLPVANGGTNSNAALSGSSIMVSNGSAIVQGGAGTTTTVLHGNPAGTPTYGAVSLTTDVSGTLPVGNGGTGATTLTGVLKGNGGSAFGVMTGAAGYIVRWQDANTISSTTFSDTGSALNLNSHPIINVTDPTNSQDAATKIYVDSQLSGTSGKTWNRDGNSLGGSEFIGSTNPKDLVFKTNGTIGMTLTSTQVLDLANPLAIADGGTGAAALTGNGIVYANPGGTALTATALTNGQLLIGNTGNPPSAAGLAGTTNRVTVTPGAGTITLSGPQDIHTGASPTFLGLNLAGLSASSPLKTDASKNLASGAIDLGTGEVTGTLVVGKGGTGLTTYAVGDLLYASGTGTVGKLADIGTGNALLSGGANTAPAYGKIGLTTHISGTLAIGNGGTNSATALSGNSIMVSNGTSIVQGNTGTATQVLHGNLGYAAVSLTADVSGTLPVGNGGTGATTFAAGEVLVGNGGSAVGTIANGKSVTFTVVTSTTGPTCASLTFDRGVLTGNSVVTCP